MRPFLVWELHSVGILAHHGVTEALLSRPAVCAATLFSLAIGRALMTNPRLLILDGATEGLAPLVHTEILKCLDTLKSCGQSILEINKNVQALNRIAVRHTMIEKGSVVWTGTPRELQEIPALRYRYWGV
jgi:branched-chain amino acid transport system ATP-binding protein